MKIWKRNAIIASVLLLVCAGAYLNWSRTQKSDATDLTETLSAEQVMGEDTLVVNDGDGGRAGAADGTAKSTGLNGSPLDSLHARNQGGTPWLNDLVRGQCLPQPNHVALQHRRHQSTCLAAVPHVVRHPDLRRQRCPHLLRRGLELRRHQHEIQLLLCRKLQRHQLQRRVAPDQHKTPHYRWRHVVRVIPRHLLFRFQ